MHLHRKSETRSPDYMAKPHSILVSSTSISRSALVADCVDVCIRSYQMDKVFELSRPERLTPCQAQRQWPNPTLLPNPPLKPRGRATLAEAAESKKKKA